jgi:hypothetical protein
MPRFLTVNGFSASPPVPRGSEDLNFDPDANVAPEFGIETTDSGIESDGYGVEQTADGVATTRYGVTSTIRKDSGDQGPCLYFGPQGQRCDRRAIANGFCRRHLPAQLGQPAQLGVASPVSKLLTGVASPADKPFARLIAVVAALAVLWPVIADLFRELIRWIHAH